MTADEKILLPVKSIEQEYKYNCGPTALLIALKFQYSLPLTQGDVNLLTGVTPDGCTEHHLIRALNLLGLKYKETGKGTLTQLRDYLKQSLVPIVHVVLEDGGGHYMVVVGMDDAFVHLADPRNGDVIQYGIPFFLGVWKEEAKENATPWYIVVLGKAPKQKLDSMINKLNRIHRKMAKVAL